MLTAALLPGWPAVAQPSATLSLEVRDRAGAAVAGALLEVAATGEDAAAPTLWSSDEEGNCSLVTAPGGYRVTTRAEGFMEHGVAVSLTSGPGPTITINLFPGAAPGGRVLDPAGDGLPGAEVCLKLEDWAFFPGEALASTALDKGKTCEETDDHGKVQFPLLPHGRYELKIEADDLMPLDAPFTLGPGTESMEWQLGAGGAVTGRVTDRDDRGVAAAVIRLAHRQRDVSVEASTDEEGLFRAAGLAPGHWTVRIEPPGGVSFYRDGVEVTDGGEVDLGQFKLRPGAVLEGIVVDGDNQPVAEAELRVHEGETRRAIRSAKTGDAGRFEIDGLPADELMLVVKPPEGYAARLVEDVAAPQRDLRIEIEEAGAICGVVVAEGALPTRIRLRAETQGKSGLLKPHTETDEVDPDSGRFCVENVLPGEKVELTARASGYWADPLTLAVAPAEEAGPVELRLERGLSAEGSVLDPDGAPIADAAVRAGEGTHVFTDLLGEFRLDGLRPGMNRVIASHPEWAEGEQSVMAPLPQGERVVLELGAGGTVEGTVLDIDGNAVEGIRIAIEKPEQWAVTDAFGRYRMGRVPAGVRRVKRTATRGQTDFEQREIEVTHGETVTVDFRLGAVLGGVVARAGAPIPGAYLAIARPEDWAGQPGREHAVQRTYTDDAGSYRLPGVRPGWATATLFYGRQDIRRPVEIPSGSEPRLDFNLPDVPIHGLVIDAADDSPIAGAHVRNRPAEPAGVPASDGSSSYSSSDSLGQRVSYALSTAPSLSTSSDDQGRFTLYVDGSGEPEIGVWAYGYVWEQQAYDLQRPQPLTFRMSREVKVHVYLRDAQGRPVADTNVCFDATDRNSRSCTSGSGDHVQQSHKEGSYNILASSTGFGTRFLDAVELKLEPGTDVKEMTLNLTPGAALVIQLVGQSTPETKVVALLDPGGKDRSVAVEQQPPDPVTGDARWKTRPLEPGAWRISVDPGNGEVLTKEVSIVPGPDVVVTFP